MPACHLQPKIFELLPFPEHQALLFLAQTQENLAGFLQHQDSLSNLTVVAEGDVAVTVALAVSCHPLGLQWWLVV